MGRMMPSKTTLLKRETRKEVDLNERLDEGELVQLQNRIIHQQDQQLDSLGELIGRQKKVRCHL
jgi:hypothetical protein